MMKIFDDERGIRRSIEFFRSLSEQDKVTIVSDLSPITFKMKQYHGVLASLLAGVQQAISKFDEIAIGNRLAELGLDDTYARLFVANIKKHAPTEEYQLHQISKIPDELFVKSVPEIIKSTVIDHVREDKLAEKFNVGKEQLRCIIAIVQNGLNELARGDTTKEKLEAKYSNRISPAKLESMLNGILVHQKHWYDSLSFSNTQDTYLLISRVAKQNDAIMESLGEMLDILRSERPHGGRRGV